MFTSSEKVKKPILSHMVTSSWMKTNSSPENLDGKNPPDKKTAPKIAILQHGILYPLLL